MRSTTIKRLAMLVAAAAALAGCNGYADIARPDDSDVRYVMPKDLAPEDNAYIAFVAATNAVLDWSGADYRLKADEATDESVFANEAAFALYHEAAQKPYWIQPGAHGDDPLSPDTALYFFSNINWSLFHRLIDRRIKKLIGRGEIDAAIDGIEDVLALTRTASRGNVTLVGYQVVLGVGDFSGFQNAIHLAQSAKASDDQLRRLLGILDAVPSVRTSFPSAIRSEYDNFFCAEAILLKDSSNLRTWWGRPTYQPNKTWQAYINFLRQALALAEKGYDREAWTALETDLKRKIGPEGGDAAREYWRDNENGLLMLATICPAYATMAEDVTRADWRVAAARITVANELFRRRNGRYAESLEELVPEYQKEVPVDPFGKGAPVNYDVKRGVIYSVGPEGDVNGEVTARSNPKTLRYIIHLDGTWAERPKKAGKGMSGADALKGADAKLKAVGRFADAMPRDGEASATFAVESPWSLRMGCVARFRRTLRSWRRSARRITRQSVLSR